MFISRHTLKWTKTCRSSGDFPHAHTAHFLLNRHTQVLAALRRGRGLIVAGRAGLLPCIHDTTTAANPIVVNQAPGHASTSRSN